MGLVGWGRGPTPATPGPAGRCAQATPSVIALPSLSPWTVAVAELDDVDNRWGHRGRRGSREDAERRARTHGDDGGRRAMGSFRKSPPPDADKPIILAPSE